MKNQTSLITGCTSGIGLHLAHEFARHGHDLVLVAPVAEELDALSESLSSRHGIETYPIASDLEQEESPARIFESLKQAGIDVEILVNNAGHGFHGRFDEHPLEVDESMVRLNVLAPLRMTKLFLPPMLARGRGRILNTASVAGFEPGPLLAVYHATKAFVLSWSEALSMELKESGIGVTILCPGPTDTDFQKKANMEDTRAFQQAKVMDPQEVAAAGYEGMVNHELIVIPGVANKALVAARRILTVEAQARLNEKMYERVPSPKTKHPDDEKTGDPSNPPS